MVTKGILKDSEGEKGIGSNSEHSLLHHYHSLGGKVLRGSQILKEENELTF